MTPKLFDIFSKKKIRIVEKPKIIADYREKNSLVISVLMSHGAEVEIKELKVADYIVKDVAIERKTVSDFLSSMLNKRLIKQLEEIQQYKNKLLIIEGIEDYPNCLMKIFNRWGQQVFETTGYSELKAWDGKIKSGMVSEGVYYYILDLRTEGLEIIKGSIT